MPHVRDLMASNPEGWLQHLIDQYQILVTKDNETDTRLVSLKYNQIESDMSQPVVQECRGMVVDIKTRSILAHPYNKFWNMGDHLAQPLDWASARVQEKLDGSLMSLFWDPLHPLEVRPAARVLLDNRDIERLGNWTVASSGHPTAGGRVGKAETTFGQLFWQTFSDLGMGLPHWSGVSYRSDINLDECKMLVRSTTFMFELMTADNRIVVRHDKPRLVVHGARDIRTEREWSRLELENFAKSMQWEIVKEYPISDADQALKAAAELDPMQTEGFVVVDNNFNRVKIKSPKYVALHHLKGEFSPRRAIELWQAGEIGELLSHFPEMTPDVQPVCDALDAMAALALADYMAHRALPTRKDYALAIKDKPWSSICFKLFSEAEPTEVTAKTILRNLSVAALERMIGS